MKRLFSALLCLALIAGSAACSDDETTRPGYRLVMQNGALLESSCPFITDKLREMQIEDIQPYEMLSALPESARRQFYDMAGFDYDKFAALFDACMEKGRPLEQAEFDALAARMEREGPGNA